MISSGRIAFTLTRIVANGSPTTFKATWPREGGLVTYETESPAGRSIVETLIRPGEWLVTQMQDGKQLVTIHKAVSKDGKTMRQIVKGIDNQGNSYEQLQVFDRQ